MSEVAGEGLLVTPDFSETAEDVGEGVYKARIVDSKLGKWDGKDGKKDTHFINWTLETFAEAEPKNNGRRIYYRTPITGRGAGIFARMYKAVMGEDYPKGQALDRTMLHGREVEVTVGVQRDNPQYTEVKGVKSLAAQH